MTQIVAGPAGKTADTPTPKGEIPLPFLMGFLEPGRLYTLSQGSTTACPASSGSGEVSEMTPDD